jgi:hypothetical protein
MQKKLAIKKKLNFLGKLRIKLILCLILITKNTNFLVGRRKIYFTKKIRIAFLENYQEKE